MGQVYQVPFYPDLLPNEIKGNGLLLCLVQDVNVNEVRTFRVASSKNGVIAAGYMSQYSTTRRRLNLVIASTDSFDFRFVSYNATTGNIFNPGSVISVNGDSESTGLGYSISDRFTEYENGQFEVYINPYNDLNEAITALRQYIPAGNNITYRLVNCTAPSAPQSAVSGSTVNVNLLFPEGFGIINPENDVYVTNNGTRIPSTYNNGLLTFTMP